MIDATHKTNDLDMPFYTMMSIDGNGASQVIASFLVHKEDEASIRQMVQVFKTKNPEHNRIKVILTDKDMVERNVFKSELPQVKLQICLFHVLRTFGREISVEKMGITLAEKKTYLDLIQSITYARDEEDYNRQYSEFESILPQEVLKYYNKNWHPVKEEWVEGLKSQEMNLYTRTNNRLESFFSKLKSVVSRRGDIKDLLSKFMGLLTTLRTERNHKYIVNRF